MPLVPGLSPSIRQSGTEGLGAIAPNVSVQRSYDAPADVPQVDDSGAIIRIEHADGSVTVSTDGRPLVEPEKKKPSKWFANLVEDIDDMEVSRIADELIRGIEDDIESRKEWVEERAQGIKLLGLKIELPDDAGTDGAPVEGMSKVRHPLLQEAVLRFQANARSEFLPTDGPCKIRDDGNNGTLERDKLANALEKDFNHYLTSTATEYVPDTDRMLLMLGFGGDTFKKVHFCPLRNRPVSESVDADDLIVNQSATDLANAKRVTHRVKMRPSTVRRMQIIGAYRDIDLHTPHDANLDAAQQAKLDQQGIAASPSNPVDRDREIYECYCELDIKGFEHQHKGKPSGLEIPYRVTIDVSSRKVLSIVRNYNEDTKDLPEARVTFVHYIFVPGFGFYSIGLLHILGNTTNAVTAAWRLLLDSGMFNNFPGFLMADTGARQNTTVFRVPPGGGALVKTGGLPIKDACMALPYPPPSPALMQLVDNIAQTGVRVGGAAETPTGEGKANAPVGTILALIEQATIVLNSVHKRMHTAQAQELQLLADCFREHPNSFWQRKRKKANVWDEQTFLAALEEHELVPQADPNTSSHIQRIMKIMALKQLQTAQPTLYDPIAIDTAALEALGFSNPNQFFAPPDAQGAPPPQLVKDQAESAAKTMQAQAAMLKAQADAGKAQAETEQIRGGLAGGGAPQETATDRLSAKADVLKKQGDLTVAQAKAQAELINAHTRAHEADTKRATVALGDGRDEEDRKSRQHVELLKLAGDVINHHKGLQADQQAQHADHQHERGLAAEEHEHERDLQSAEAEARLKEVKAKPKPKPAAKGKD